MSLRHAAQDLRRQFRLVRRHLRYGRASFGGQGSPAKSAALQELFRGVNGWLRSSGVEYTLAFGTLLGWHREHRLLPHDVDIDFAAPVAEYGRLLRNRAALPVGYRLYDTSYRHFGPKLYVSHGVWEADIYFYSESGGMLQSLERCRNPGDVAPFPREYFFPRQPAEFLGEPTHIPADPVALLTTIYGYIGPNAVRDPQTRYFRPRHPA